MLKSVNYNTLAALGITIWHPRSGAVVAEPLRINAKCAILLFEPINSSAEQKILQGMISVLNLPIEQLMLVKSFDPTTDLTKIADNLQQWCPYSVLQLSMDLPAVETNAHVIRTFSPSYLLKNVQQKAQAYKDLLTLRKILHHDNT